MIPSESCLIGVDTRRLGTTNGGATWTVLAQPQAPGLPTGIAGVSFSDSNNGIAVTFNNKLFISRDGGASWSAANPPVPVQAVCDDADGTQWLLGGTGVYESADQGSSWTLSHDLAISGSNLGQASLECSGKGIWAMAGSTDLGGHINVYLDRSLDDGSGWQSVLAPGSGNPSVASTLASAGTLQLNVPSAQEAWITGDCAHCDSQASGNASIWSLGTTDGGSAFNLNDLGSSAANGGSGLPFLVGSSYAQDGQGSIIAGQMLGDSGGGTLALSGQAGGSGQSFLSSNNSGDSWTRAATPVP